MVVCGNCDKLLYEHVDPCDTGGVVSSFYHEGGQLFCHPDDPANYDEAAPVHVTQTDDQELV